MNIYEAIRTNEEQKTMSPEEFFSTEGLTIAKEICIKNKRSNCCKEVSEAVVSRAKELGIDCSVINPVIFIAGKEDPYLNHYVILNNNKIIDFTHKQFLGSNSESDVELLIYPAIMDSVYANEELGKSNINDKVELIKKFTKGEIKGSPLVYVTDWSMDDMIKLNAEEQTDKEKLTESSYEEDFFLEIEDALVNAGFDVSRYSDVGMLTKNLGWVVSNSEGEVKLTCDGTILDENELPEDPFKYLTEEEIKKFVESEIVYTKQVVDSDTKDSMMFTEDYSDEDAINAFIKDYYPESKPEHCYVEYFDEPLVYKVDNIKSVMTEAANPDNAEANELIKKALSDATFAYENADKLKDLGITVDYKLWSDEKTVKDNGSFAYCELIGKNGRRLRCNTSTFGSRMSGEDLKRVKDYYNGGKEDERVDTISPKSYKTSREAVNTAKQELPTLKRRLNLYERRYGKDSSQYRELLRYIDKTQKTIDDGIRAGIDTYATLNKDIDYKNYLDSKRMEDRPKPANPNAQNANVAKFKDAKWDEQYNKRWELRNKELDKEDAESLAKMAQRNAEEKVRRDTQLQREKDRVKATLDELRQKIADSKAKRGAN